MVRSKVPIYSANEYCEAVANAWVDETNFILLTDRSKNCHHECKWSHQTSYYHHTQQEMAQSSTTNWRCCIDRERLPQLQL
jgi:hypothetical protein